MFAYNFDLHCEYLFIPCDVYQRIRQTNNVNKRKSIITDLFVAYNNEPNDKYFVAGRNESYE